MRDNLISQIIQNYKEQYNLYKQMLDLSVQQVNLLRDNYEDIGNLHAILNARKALMEEIISLNIKNKTMQSQLLSQLGIKEFVIKKLDGLVEDKDLKALDQIVTDISSLLNRINENDMLNETLIKQGIKKKPEVLKSTSPHRATQAYKQAMQKEQ